MRGAILTLIIVMALIVSGCSSSGTNALGFSETEGLRINSFTFLESSMTDAVDDTNTIEIEIENVGGKDLPGNASVFLYGPQIGPKPEDWRLNPSPYCDGDDIRPDCPNFLVQAIRWNLSVNPRPFFAPSEELGEKGSVKVFSAEILAPNVRKGITTQYSFYTRLCYPYETSSSSTVTALSKTSFESKPSKGLAETRSSAGPVKIELLSLEKARVRDDRLPLRFEITNVGGGFPTAPNSGDGKFTCENSISSKPERNVINFAVIVNGKQICPATEYDTVTLFDGKASYLCDKKDLDALQMGSLELQVVGRAEYNYNIDAETSVEVVDSYYDEDVVKENEVKPEDEEKAEVVDESIEEPQETKAENEAYPEQSRYKLFEGSPIDQMSNLFAEGYLPATFEDVLRFRRESLKEETKDKDLLWDSHLWTGDAIAYHSDKRAKMVRLDQVTTLLRELDLNSELSNGGLTLTEEQYENFEGTEITDATKIPDDVTKNEILIHLARSSSSLSDYVADASAERKKKGLDEKVLGVWMSDIPNTPILRLRRGQPQS